jgi:hypothetical protein
MKRQLLRLTVPTNRYGAEITLFFHIPEPTGDGLPAPPLDLYEGNVGPYRVLRDMYGEDTVGEGISSRGKAREVYDWLYKNPDSSGDQVAAGIGVKPNQARDCLSRLKERGEIVQSRTTPRPVLWRCATAETRGENNNTALLHSSQGKAPGSADTVQSLHNNCTPETQSGGAVQKCSTSILPKENCTAQQNSKIDNSPIEVGDSVSILGSVTADPELLRPVWTVAEIRGNRLKLQFGDTFRSIPPHWVALLSKGAAA